MCSFSESDRNGGVDAEDLVANSMEEGEALEDFVGNGRRSIVDRREVCADFFAQAGLVFGVFAERVDRPHH